VIAGPIPVGTTNAKQNNRPKRAVFLLSFADFSVKTGVKNSYAPRVSLVGIFQRTRYRGTQIASIINPNRLGKPQQHFFFFIRLEMIQFFPTNQGR